MPIRGDDATRMLQLRRWVELDAVRAMPEVFCWAPGWSCSLCSAALCR